MLDDRTWSEPVFGRTAPTSHQTAVANSLAWADDAAETLDFADALGWLAAVEATGTDLSDAYVAKRATWTLLL